MTETFSFTTSAIPSEMTCYFSTENLSKYSETHVEVSLDFESGMIESASEAGEVFVSEETAKLLGEGSTVEVGTFELKGIDGEAMLYRLAQGR